MTHQLKEAASEIHTMKNSFNASDSRFGNLTKSVQHANDQVASLASQLHTVNNHVKQLQEHRNQHAQLHTQHEKQHMQLRGEHDQTRRQVSELQVLSQEVNGLKQSFQAMGAKI